MTREEDIQKLKDARNKIAEVYEAQAIDEAPDDGNLTSLNNAILTLNESIKKIIALG
ncbi:hypothetical protein LCGC14_1048310 [marine sediment metagenome]|uniref:Uncharacterized protein n=1 Tax=marine sediment metagenome TaxID=412755 RepID=A0A0F9NBH6_9ZZZZ